LIYIFNTFKEIEMGEESSITTKEENHEEDSKEEEDLLYTHKPENRGNGIQWNSTFYRKPGH
jgi:hypothetical protein